MTNAGAFGAATFLAFFACLVLAFTGIDFTAVPKPGASAGAFAFIFGSGGELDGRWQLSGLVIYCKTFSNLADFSLVRSYSLGGLALC